MSKLCNGGPQVGSAGPPTAAPNSQRNDRPAPWAGAGRYLCPWNELVPMRPEWTLEGLAPHPGRFPRLADSWGCV